MKRLLLDTNIYGLMILDKELEEIKNLIKRKVIVYGTDVIRKEMRQAPRRTTRYSKNLKLDLLRLYDSLVKHGIYVDAKIAKLANSYYLAYSKFGGRLNKASIINDLLIVAAASVKELDIVVSGDKKTMLGSDFQRIYELVNELNGKETPVFHNYKEFKLILRRLPL